MNAINPLTTPRSKTRRTREQWQQLVDAYLVSGLTQAQYCQAQEIAVSSFCKWKAKLNSECSLTTTDSEFVALPMPVPTHRWRIELDLGDGSVLRIR